MREVTIQFTDEQWREIEDYWEYWNDESFALHAAYFLREALIRAGYIAK